MFNKALIAAATAAFISATAAPVTQAEAGSLNFSISFGKKSFKKSFKRKLFKRRASLRRGNKNRRRANTNRRSRKATRPASRKCASGLRVQGVCMSESYKRKLEAANKEANKHRLYLKQMRRCDAKFDAQQRAGVDLRKARNAVTRCMDAVNKRFS